ncbi:MAG TPA: hypothetical protein VJP79_09850 [Nitrososphaera sp.]|nr:hypothetical protein [Nitrososphaera sp.]
MSDGEGSTSVIDLEGNFRTTDVELPQFQESPEQQAEQKVTSTEHLPEKPPRKPRLGNHSSLSDLRMIHKNKIQEILKKHASERKLLQKEIKEQAKRSREDLGRALKQTERSYRLQLEQLRHDHESRNAKLQSELEIFLTSKMDEMKQHSQGVVQADSQERLQKLQEWLQGEFVSEMQNKTSELERVKASSDAQVRNLVHEVDRKNQEIVFLHGKIREISSHLKKGMREELLEELGLGDVESERTKKNKNNKKIGLFARLGSKF